MKFKSARIDANDDGTYPVPMPGKYAFEYRN